jgi:hypothetical protein
MNTPMRPATPRHVPTLTEVIEVDSLQEPAGQVTAEPALEVTSQPQPQAPLPELAMPVAQPAVPPPVPDLQDAPIPRSMLVDRSAWGATTAPGALSAPLRAAALPSSPSQPAPRQPSSASVGVGAASMGATDAPSTGVDEALITQRVLADLQRQIDGMLEYRLRETLAPVLARTTEALVRELRQELSKTMKDVVARSVAQEVARQRSRG